MSNTPLHPHVSDAQISTETSPSTTSEGVGDRTEDTIDAPRDMHLVGVTADSMGAEEPHSTASRPKAYPQTIHLEDSYPPIHMPSLEEISHRGDSIIACLHTVCTLHPHTLRITIVLNDATSHIDIDLSHTMHQAAEVTSDIPVLPAPPPSSSMDTLLKGKGIRPTSLEIYVQMEERHERMILGIGIGAGVHEVGNSSVDTMYVRESRIFHRDYHLPTPVRHS